MRDVVICEPLRTPIGRYGGSLAGVSAADLGATVLRELVARTGVPVDAVDDVVLGHCNPNAEAPAIGRVVALDAGLPVTVPGQQIDRRCGSGLQAVLSAATAVATGIAELVVAGGTESMSNVSFYSTDIRWGAHRTGVTMHDALVRARSTAGGQHYPVTGGMVETAENVRAHYGISREAQDRLAVESHERAVRAQKDGIFDEEIVPVRLPGPVGEAVVTTDEHPREDTSLEQLATLKPMLRATVPDATVTAGNSSGQNDAAAICLVTTLNRSHELGLRPLARVVSAAVSGVEPRLMGIGPVPATERALARVDLRLDDMDVIELNEAFAAQVLAVVQEWGLGADDMDRVNPHGSGISLGHPVGATGARLIGTAARELDRRSGRYALATLCIGGGQGMALVLERVPS